MKSSFLQKTSLVESPLHRQSLTSSASPLQYTMRNFRRTVPTALVRIAGRRRVLRWVLTLTLRTYQVVYHY